jgi:hypothetical protein
MPSPFPDMDPYLEHPEIWPEFHNRLIVAVADDLGPQLRPKYRVAAVITNLAVISPSNQRAAKGRQVYEERRLKILSS